jgi:hypothetical protein
MAPFRNDFQRVLRRNHNTSRTGIMAAALLVTRARKSRIAAFAAPSF